MFEYTFNKNIKTVDLFDAFDDSEEEEMLLKEVIRFNHCWKTDDRSPWDTLQFYVDLHIWDPTKSDHRNKYISSICTGFTMTNLKEITKSGFIEIDSIKSTDEIEFGYLPKLSLTSYIFLYKFKDLFKHGIDYIRSTGVDKTEQIFFPKPLQLEAQNSNNRSGYGWGEDKYYGDTTTYYITGFTIRKKKWLI